jgi:hypothetical protein
MKHQKKVKWISLMIPQTAGKGQWFSQQVETTRFAPEMELSDNSVLNPGLLPI